MNNEIKFNHLELINYEIDNVKKEIKFGCLWLDYCIGEIISCLIDICIAYDCDEKGCWIDICNYDWTNIDYPKA